MSDAERSALPRHPDAPESSSQANVVGLPALADEDPDLEPEPPKLSEPAFLAMLGQLRDEHGLKRQALSTSTLSTLGQLLPLYSAEQWHGFLRKVFTDRTLAVRERGYPLAAILTPGVLEQRMPDARARQRLCCVCREPQGDASTHGAPRALCSEHFYGAGGWYAEEFSEGSSKQWWKDPEGRAALFAAWLERQQRRRSSG